MLRMLLIRWFHSTRIEYEHQTNNNPQPPEYPRVAHQQEDCGYRER